MADKPKCILTVDVEALAMRAPNHHVDALIYGRSGGQEWGIVRMMDIADRYGVKMTFFLDFAEVELYGDEIIQAGKSILERGHDLQLHCHYDLLSQKVRERFPDADPSYYVWYENEEISEFIIDYCIGQYKKCAGRLPLIFRGGEYRFGAALIKKLKEKGLAADASYHFMRPRKLPVNKQFLFENELLELPAGILPKREGEPEKSLNFNDSRLYPSHPADWDRCLGEYEAFFQEYYDYYGDDAFAAFIMHSWSFCYHRERAEKTGYYDAPENGFSSCAADFFEQFLKRFCGRIDFITASQAVSMYRSRFIKKIDFDSVFALCRQPMEKLGRIETFIRQKAGKRKVVIWGRGWIEGRIMRMVNFHHRIPVAFYISKDAGKMPVWREKEVKTFEEAHLSPKEYYVFIAADPCHAEIRDSIKLAGFSQYEDYYDIADFVSPLPEEGNSALSVHDPGICPVCGGSKFEAYNSEKPRRCVKCGSVERNRTMSKLFSENVKADLPSSKILHVSACKSERMFFEKANAHHITTLDIRPQVKPDVVADICHMPQIPSDSYDIVFANCVLNHVYDDEAALSEIYRVLKNHGLFITWVTGSGGMNTVACKNPTGWYGQEMMDTYRVGTYRYYGESDFMKQLQQHFQTVECYEKYDVPSELSCCWYVCGKQIREELL